MILKDYESVKMPKNRINSWRACPDITYAKNKMSTMEYKLQLNVLKRPDFTKIESKVAENEEPVCGRIFVGVYFITIKKKGSKKLSPE